MRKKPLNRSLLFDGRVFALAERRSALEEEAALGGEGLVLEFFFCPKRIYFQPSSEALLDAKNDDFKVS